jgi:ABC-2 type transport system permease protein
VTAVVGAPADAVLHALPEAPTANRPPVARPGRVRAFTRLLAAERIKLASTRSPWWCAAVVVVLLVGLTALVAAQYLPEQGSAWISIAGIGAVPMAVVAVLASLAVTSEHRTATMRTTFLTAPNRVPALLAKTVVVAGAAAVLGLVASFTAWGVARVVAPQADLALSGAGPWRAVAGVGAVYAVVAVLAVAVGILVRHGAGAIALLMVWILVGEGVLGALPRVGPDIAAWLPMRNLGRFLVAGIVDPDPSRSFFGERYLFGPWAALGYAAGVAIAVLAVGVAVARRRDA